MAYEKPLRTAEDVRAAGFDPNHIRGDEQMLNPFIHIGMLEFHFNRNELLSPEVQASLDFLHTLISDQGLELDRLRARELAR